MAEDTVDNEVVFQDYFEQIKADHRFQRRNYWSSEIKRLTGEGKANEIPDLIVKVEEEATYDPLTGFFNQIGLLKRLDTEEFPALARNKEGYSLFFIDLDGLKKINDTEGHHKGDEVIRKLSLSLRQSIRPKDLISRWTRGDEFVVFLPNCELSEGNKIMDRLRTLIPAGVSASMGIASGSSREDFMDTVIDADRKMQQEKTSKKINNGR